MASPENDFSDLDSIVCPVTPTPEWPIFVDPVDVAAGQARLAALRGYYLPPPETAAPRTRGATKITGGATEPVLARDLTNRAANLSFGFVGEQGAAFMYGRSGYHILSGSSGNGGKRTNGSGADNLPYNPQTKEIIFNDNKSSTTPGPVRTCTALNENLLQSIDRAIDEVSGLQNFADRELVLDKLTATKAAFAQGPGGRLPPGVRFEITNCGGFISGISESLNADFISRYKGVLDSSGNQVKLEFKNMQFPETTDAARAGAGRLMDESRPPIPFNEFAIPGEPASQQFEAVSSSASVSTAPELAFAAGPVIVNALKGLLEFALPRLGFKSDVERAVDSAITNDVLPHLRTDPKDGALLLATIHLRQMNIDVDPSYSLSPIISFYAMTPTEAYSKRIAQAMFVVHDDPGVTAHDLYYWYKDGHLAPYFPAPDQLMAP